jgi:enterochelin esterase-like enzyme
VLPGKYRLDTMLGACGSDPGVPDVAAGPVTAQRFFSRYRDRTVQMIVMRPPGVSGPLPVVLVLHGLGDDAASAVSLGYPQYLAAAVAAGTTPFAVVAADGGGSTYWHRRADGDDPQGMLISEVLPRLGRQGYPAGRIGVAGWSMGGYGALLLAARLGPARVAAVGALSPAIFASYADAIAANPLSFDSPADFAANDIQSPAAIATLRRMPVLIDCGSGDPFAPQDAALRAEIGHVAGAIGSGCHDQAFWRRSLPAELAFLGTHLSPPPR